MPEWNPAAGNPKIDMEYLRELGRKIRNWGKWGDDDELGTMNYITPEKVIEAAGLVQKGKVFSLSTPFDAKGPQRGGIGRFNPIHLMIRDGGDVEADLTLGTDDIITMPLQCATQWDSLAHIFFDKVMYNNRPTKYVSSFGAEKNSVTNYKNKIVSRGVLLDIARFKGKDWMDAGEPIFSWELDACAEKQGVKVGTGDILLIRTGQMGQVKATGVWGEYDGGPAPGLSLETAEWLFRSEIAAYATDTWGTEVIPNETDVVTQPLHRVIIPSTGMLVGEIFDLEDLAADCAEDGRYDFMFVAPPLMVTGAVGSPVNPHAIK